MNRDKAGRGTAKPLRLPVRLLCAGVCCCVCSSLLGAEPARNAQTDMKLWRWSLVAVAAGQAADLATSHRGSESNPRLRNESGELATGRAIGIKSGITVGSALFQAWTLRRWPNSRAARVFAVVNFGIAGLHGGVAAHNLRVRVPHAPVQ